MVVRIRFTSRYDPGIITSPLAKGRDSPVRLVTTVLLNAGARSHRPLTRGVTPPSVVEARTYAPLGRMERPCAGALILAGKHRPRSTSNSPPSAAGTTIPAVFATTAQQSAGAWRTLARPARRNEAVSETADNLATIDMSHSPPPQSTVGRPLVQSRDPVAPLGGAQNPALFSPWLTQLHLHRHPLLIQPRRRGRPLACPQGHAVLVSWPILAVQSRR